jgi:hypothetical protein
MNTEKLETEIARALRDNQDALALQLIQLRERLAQAAQNDSQATPRDRR